MGTGELMVNKGTEYIVEVNKGTGFMDGYR